MGNLNKANLRNWQPDASDAKDVRETKMLDTTAKDMNATGTNSQKEYVTGSGKPKGPLGAKGRN